MEQAKSTRMELLARKSQVALAMQGSKLLKGKREALLKELMQMIKPLVDHHTNLSETLKQATRSLTMAEAFDGRSYLKSLSMASGRKVNVVLDEKVVWGVHMPEFTISPIRRGTSERGAAASGLTSCANEAASDFEALLEELLQLMPLHIRLHRLGSELRKTSRRVNALDQVLIPRLTDDIKVISQALEEIEREDTFRLRRIKQKKGR